MRRTRSIGPAFKRGIQLDIPGFSPNNSVIPEHPHRASARLNVVGAEAAVYVIFQPTICRAEARIELRRLKPT